MYLFVVFAWGEIRQESGTLAKKGKSAWRKQRQAQSSNPVPHLSGPHSRPVRDCYAVGAELRAARAPMSCTHRSQQEPTNQGFFFKEGPPHPGGTPCPQCELGGGGHLQSGKNQPGRCSLPPNDNICILFCGPFSWKPPGGLIFGGFLSGVLLDRPRPGKKPSFFRFPETLKKIFWSYEVIPCSWPSNSIFF